MNKCKTLRRMAAAALALAALATAISASAASPIAIVALGDSLTAGLGLGLGESFPEQLEAALKAKGHDVTVENAGVSGDTATDGLTRLEWSVPAEAKIVIVELGANDALRGVDPSVTRKALSEILSKLTGRGQTVLLAGMLAPPNLGDAYAKAFNPIYSDLAAQYSIKIYPFFLDGVAANQALNQPDGMHPTAAGVAKIVQRMLPDVEALLETIEAGG
jgi:acyl-CoA thioesterase-1